MPGFTPVIDAEVVFGADWLYTDPDGSKARLNVKGVAKYGCPPQNSPVTVTWC